MKHEPAGDQFNHENEPQSDEQAVSDMRRVSLSLTFNPARIRRRSKMNEANTRRSRWWGRGTNRS